MGQKFLGGSMNSLMVAAAMANIHVMKNTRQYNSACAAKFLVAHFSLLSSWFCFESSSSSAKSSWKLFLFATTYAIQKNTVKWKIKGYDCSLTAV